MEIITTGLTRFSLGLVLSVFTLVVAVSSQRACEQLDGALNFYYKCLSEEVRLCLPGRHLRIPLPECEGMDRDRICEACANGYIANHNKCNDCNPWTECGPDEMEDSRFPPNAITDRTCIPRPPSTVKPTSNDLPALFTTQPNPTPSPERLTSDAPSTVRGTEGRGTSPALDAGFSTPPQEDTLTPARMLADCDIVHVWKPLAIVSITLIFIFVCVGCLLVAKKMCKSDRCLKREVLPNDAANGRLSSQPADCAFEMCPTKLQTIPDGGSAKADNDADRISVLNVDLPPETSAANSLDTTVLPATNSTPPKSTCPSVGASGTPQSSRSPPFADEESFEDQTDPLLAPQGARADNDGVDSRTAEGPVDEDNSSHQLLLSGNATVTSNAPTTAFHGDNAASSQNPSNGAAYRPSLSTLPSVSAFERADCPCEVTQFCSEWHVDFVKDEIAVNTHIDFFTKLGVSKKHYDATMYDTRNESIREQIRRVMINDFIEKSDKPYIHILLSALEESGNCEVARRFRKKFNVTDRGGC